MVITEPTKQKKTHTMNIHTTNNEVSATMCSNCGTTTTPLWRRAPNGDTICNACGLYLKARNTLRPPSMKRNFKKSQQVQQQPQEQTTTFSAADAPMGTCPGGGQCNGTGGSASCEGCPAFNQHQVNRHALICANCRTTTTPLWRRDEAGNTICNACGLYYKLHHVHRPVSMKRSIIKRRKRIIVSDNGEMDEVDELDSSSNSSGHEDDDEDDEEKVKAAAQKKLQVAKRKRKVIHNHKKPCPSSSSSSSTVPAIEDYIVPKRVTLQEHEQQQQQHQQQQQAIITSQRLPPPPRTPPLNPTFHSSRTLPSVSSAFITTKRFDPLFDYRSARQAATAPPQTSSSSSSPPPPAPLPSSSSQSPPKDMYLPPILTNNNRNPYQDLAEFDEAMTRLERLRRRVPPEQSKTLSSLTQSLEDIVSKAESILIDQHAMPMNNSNYQLSANNSIRQHPL
jgi:GATA-binding protein